MGQWKALCLPAWTAQYKDGSVQAWTSSGQVASGHNVAQGWGALGRFLFNSFSNLMSSYAHQEAVDREKAITDDISS